MQALVTWSAEAPICVHVLYRPIDQKDGSLVVERIAVLLNIERVAERIKEYAMYHQQIKFDVLPKSEFDAASELSPAEAAELLKHKAKQQNFLLNDIRIIHRCPDQTFEEVLLVCAVLCMNLRCVDVSITMPYLCARSDDDLVS